MSRMGLKEYSFDKCRLKNEGSLCSLCYDYTSIVWLEIEDSNTYISSFHIQDFVILAIWFCVFVCDCLCFHTKLKIVLSVPVNNCIGEKKERIFGWRLILSQVDWWNPLRHCWFYIFSAEKIQAYILCLDLFLIFL